MDLFVTMKMINGFIDKDQKAGGQVTKYSPSFITASKRNIFTGITVGYPTPPPTHNIRPRDLSTSPRHQT